MYFPREVLPLSVVGVGLVDLSVTAKLGTTTLMVTASALLPAYRRLGISPLVFGVLGAGCTTLMNMSPWGGPTARIAAALHVDPMDIFLPMLPTIAIGIACMFGFAWHFGVRERARISRDGLPSINATAIEGLALTGQEPDPAALRPRLIWFNTALTVALMTCVVLQVAPLLVLFLLGVVLAWSWLGRSAGSRLGPFGTDHDSSTPSSSRRTS